MSRKRSCLLVWIFLQISSLHNSMSKRKTTELDLYKVAVDLWEVRFSHFIIPCDVRLHS
jgi:hypothetical protein